MVIVFSKTLEKKGVNDVRCTESERLLWELHAMSRGSTLFSRGTVESDRWIDVRQDCTIQHGPPCQASTRLESLWAVLPDQCQQKNQARLSEVGNAPAITSLIRDLSLGDGTLCSAPSLSAAHPSVIAPPIKRQCRSLSFSDELGSCRSPWRPQGSRVWTAVEKRRCHSGGSVRGAGAALSAGHFPTMQRSFSFSLPSHSCTLTDGALDLPCFSRGLTFQPLFTASPSSPSSRHHQDHCPRPLSLSHEQISLSEVQREEASEASSPDSTPELGRRAGQGNGGTGGLPRSRSQPCVLNDKKIGMKRRRPEDVQEQRPSLDLAKMTQNLQTFQSLSSSGIPIATSCQSGLHKPPHTSTGQALSHSVFTSRLGSEARQDAARDAEDEDDGDSSYEEPDSDSACSVDSGPMSPADMAEEKHTLWKGERRGTRGGIVHLGGELDLDQIERN